jgi:hypothetical protein
MKRMTIYAKNDQKIDRFNVLVYEKELFNLLKKLDDYYGKQVEEYVYEYGPISTYPTQKDLDNISKSSGYDEYYKLIDISETSSKTNNFVKYCFIVVKPVGLSKIVRKILSSNFIDASYAIEELFAFNASDDVEKELLNEVKSCFNFKKEDKFDLRKVMLEALLPLEDDVSIKYTDDSTLPKSEKLPHSYYFKRKSE